MRTEPEREALQLPAASAADTASLRRALQDVTQSLERVRRVAEEVRRALAEDMGLSGDSAWAQTLAADVQGIANRPGFEGYAAIAPALAGINRSRVIAILSLG